MDKNSYMNELRKNLKGLSMEQQEDILREMEQNIADGIAAGKEESLILSRMGPPKVLAKSLIGEFYVKNNHTLKAIPFLVTTSIASFLMVFLFGGLVLLLGAGAIGSIVGGVMRTFGSTAINMTMFNMEVPQILSIPASVLTAVFLAALVYLCCRVLKRYFVHITDAYKTRYR